MARTAIVTGGARGIGRAISEKFARGGYTVIVDYHRSAEAAESLCAALRAEGCNALAFRADVSDERGANALAAFALGRFGRVDALINNAGVAESGLLTDLDPGRFDRLTAVNLRGPYLACRAVLPAMISAKSGAIVNISSVWGIVGASCEAAYSASKGGVIALTRALAKEAGPSGVRVNCVAPGVVRTDMLAEYSECDLAALAAETPLGRIGAPEEIAEAVWFLASDGARFITGQTLAVDGGFAL